MPNNSFCDSFGSDKTAAVRRCLRVKKSNFKTTWWTRIKKHPKTQNSEGGLRFFVWYLTTLTKGCLVSSHWNSLRRSLWSDAILSKDANLSIRDQQKKIRNISWWVLSSWKDGIVFSFINFHAIHKWTKIQQHSIFWRICLHKGFNGITGG